MKAEYLSILSQHLIEDEGLVLHAYQDSLGFWTLGVGRLIDKRKGGGITRTEAIILLSNDIDRHWFELIQRFPWVEWLDDVRQISVCNLAFNLGVPGLAKFKNTLAALERKDWAAAARGLRRSLWYRQVGRSRSERIIHMIEHGTLPSRTINA